MSWGIDTTNITSETMGTFGTIPTFFKWLMATMVVLILLLAVVGSMILNRNCPPLNLSSVSLDNLGSPE